MAWETEARRAVALALLLGLAGLAGCIGTDGTTETNDTSGPTGDQETTSESDGRSYDSSSKSNQPGNFAYSGAMGNQDRTENVTWTNPAPRAQISWSGSVSQGSFTLTITDVTGENVVYERTIDATTSGAIHESTNVGVPGPWTLTFEFQGFTGSMALSIQSG